MAGIREWLDNAHKINDPTGDLIADMASDPHLPLIFPNAEAMRRYLASRGACNEALQSAPIAWRRYRRWQSRHS